MTTPMTASLTPRGAPGRAGPRGALGGGGLQVEGVAPPVAGGGAEGGVLEELTVVEKGLQGREAHQGHPRRLVMDTRVLEGGGERG